MQGDNRRTSQQDQQRDDSLSRNREESPSGRGGAAEGGMRRGQPREAQSNASSRGAMQRSQDESRGASGSPSYGLMRRDQDFGFPSMLGGGGPFALLRRMEQEMDRMFGQFGLGGFGNQGMQRGSGRGDDMSSLWAPQVEVFEKEGKLHVCTDLPGLRKEDIHVDIEDDRVTIQGERRSSQESQGQHGFYRSERSYGSFYRTIPLPEGVNAENAEATFRDGVLDITFDAPPEQRRSRRLEIRDQSGEQSKK